MLLKLCVSYRPRSSVRICPCGAAPTLGAQSSVAVSDLNAEGWRLKDVLKKRCVDVFLAPVFASTHAVPRQQLGAQSSAAVSDL